MATDSMSLAAGDLELGDIYKETAESSSEVPSRIGEYTGEKNADGHRHGRGRLVRWLNKQHVGESREYADSVAVIDGMWENGQPHGLARVEVGGTVVYDGLWDRGCMLMQCALQDGEAPQRQGSQQPDAAELPLLLAQSKQTQRTEITNLNSNALEVLWHEGASRCTRRGNSVYFGGGKDAADAGESSEGIARDTRRGHVHDPQGPEDLPGFLRLVLVWFFASTVFVMTIKQ